MASVWRIIPGVYQSLGTPPFQTIKTLYLLLKCLWCLFRSCQQAMMGSDSIAPGLKKWKSPGVQPWSFLMADSLLDCNLHTNLSFHVAFHMDHCCCYASVICRTANYINTTYLIKTNPVSPNQVSLLFLECWNYWTFLTDPT